MLDLTRWKNKKNVSGKKRLEPRVKFLAWGFMIFAFFIVVKLIDFQVLKFNFYYALASDQHEIYQKLFPERGSIYLLDQSSSVFSKQESIYPLAINKDYNLIYAEPRLLEKSPEEAADLLLPLLEPDESKKESFKTELIAKLSKKNDPYEPLKHKVEDSVVEQIKNLNLTGIRWSKETYRYYPEKNIGANVLGFVGFDANGQKTGLYGIEGFFNKELAGQQGELKTEKDISGNIISIGEKDFVRAQDGADVILTLDKTVEYEVCTQLNEQAKTVLADSASAIVMDPQTGAIMAMCSWPDFDPNEYNKVSNSGDYNNRAVIDAYEPGSIFKAITMAVGLDLNLITPETTYIDDGFVKIDEFTIRNSDKLAHGQKTMTQVLEESLNTGTIFVVRKIGSKDFRKYLEKFGFGQTTGIQLSFEAVGNIEPLKKKGEIYAATASFGQGMTATPLQMVQSFAVIANGGKLIKPYIVQELRYPDGTVIKTNQPKPKQIISSKTATLLTGMLVSVIKNGHGQKAAVPGYYMGGKSGTAQIPDFEHGGYSNATNHSFIGFGPVKDPAFVMIIKFENPKKGSFAESTAMPVFSRLAKFLFNYYRVIPDDL